MNYGNGQGPPDRRDGIDAIEDPNNYAQARLVRELMDRDFAVLNRRSRAVEAVATGQAGHNLAMKALRYAVEDFLILSKPIIKNHKHSQYWFRGEPPTVSGDSPYYRRENGQLELIAKLPDEPVTLSDGQQMKAADVAASERHRLKVPILATDDDGSPPFGTEPLLLGEVVEYPPEDAKAGADDGIGWHHADKAAKRQEFLQATGRPVRGQQKPQAHTFVGLKSIDEAPDQFVFSWDTVDSHPLKGKVAGSESVTRQIPESVLMNAHSTIKDFWQLEMGIGFQQSRGKAVHRNFDQSRPDSDRDEYLDHSDHSGAPPFQ